MRAQPAEKKMLKGISLIAQHKIINLEAGLTHPSDLALSTDHKSLWTVSDKTKAIFKLNLKGELQFSESFFVDAYDLEGVTINSSGDTLYTTNEDNNEVIAIDIKTRKIIKKRPLSAMKGFDSIRKFFPEIPDNKGLEGITFKTGSDRIYVIKESQPGLLIELDTDLETIQHARLLNQSNGFTEPDTPQKKLDFSGLSYDPSSDLFWIISDKGRCIFIYDWNKDLVIQTFKLSYKEGTKNKTIRKAEGVAIDRIGRRLYVVSEKDAVLYIFELLH